MKDAPVLASFEKQNAKHAWRVFVAGGSQSGFGAAYRREALNLGKKIAEMEFGLSFGLSGKGIMGAVARGVLQGWMKKNTKGPLPIRGITTAEYLNIVKKQRFVEKIKDIIISHSLEERKNKLLKSDFVVFAPGGLGTLDELVYDCLAMQDGFLPFKPFVIFNVCGHYYHVLEYLKEIHAKGFSISLPFIVVENSNEAGIAFEMLLHYFSDAAGDRETVQSRVTTIIYQLPYVIEQKKLHPRLSVRQLLERMQQGLNKGDEKLSEAIKNTYLENEIRRTYSRLEKTGEDTAYVSQKLKTLKTGLKKWR